MPDLLGPAEVCALLGVKRNTFQKWRERRLLPEPLYVLSGIQLFERSAIQEWAQETKRTVAE